jgi:hypothetical protein
MLPEWVFMGILNNFLVRLGLRSPEYDRYRADRMRIISKKYRDSNDPLFRGSPKDYQEILETIEGAAMEGETYVVLKIHVSDEIRRNLENLGYTLGEVILEVPEGTEGAWIKEGYWYIYGTKIWF